ncbi:hypothetical protein ABEB36_011462 [Hypothenemus hampei]|uniref:Cytohesin Ubiquitin Protein Inducing domain-containing protein n=1 Tax=Hypothenemus hampei TaxID=57062 RepID=A0ABD1EFI6_HYPHA
MEDGAAVASTSTEVKAAETMGAITTNSAARKVALEERKRQIEEQLTKCNQELRALCIQEAELTGITPPEMPLEAGESPPTIRRKVGTAFQLNENLLNNASKDQLITNLELELQVHMNMRDAAYGLANGDNISKTVKRQHRAEYQKHKDHVKALEEKLALLKEKLASEQIKQKKKARIPDLQDESSMSASSSVKSENRNSQISTGKQGLNMLSPADTYPEARYSFNVSRQSQYSRNFIENHPHLHHSKPEEMLTSGFYRLSLNGYNDYIERQEVMSTYVPQNVNYPHTQPSPYYIQNVPFSSPLSQSSQSPSSPHLSHSPLSQHNNLRSPQSYSRMSQYSNLIRQSSPTSSNNKVPYYSHTLHGDLIYNRYTVDPSKYRNTIDASTFGTHPIQPHQQYENNGMIMNSGLGGYWKKSESGEMVWVCLSNTIDGNWQRDKRFGSLDRRTNKRVQRRISPVDSKSNTLTTFTYHENINKSPFVKPPQVVNRRSQEHRQLVRTQSLGSVGQTIDSVYPSDDTSSCEGDNRSFKDVRTIRKQKEKEWVESSLDSPISTYASNEKFTTNQPLPLPPQHLQQQNMSSGPSSPIIPKVPLEIPAESHPRVPEPPHIELLNNNIPKNCTIVQAGVVKPYHEETKPFEMSDFYKYSTKFKKSPQKEQISNQSPRKSLTQGRSLNDNFEDAGNMNRYSGRIQQQYVHHRESTSANINNSLEFPQVTTVSEKFSEEMNAWYQNQEHHPDNNNSSASATLV